MFMIDMEKYKIETIKEDKEIISRAYRDKAPIDPKTLTKPYDGIIRMQEEIVKKANLEKITTTFNI